MKTTFSTEQEAIEYKKLYAKNMVIEYRAGYKKPWHLVFDLQAFITVIQPYYFSA